MKKPTVYQHTKSETASSPKTLELGRKTVDSLPTARILGIETSCDETAAAVVENGHIILSNQVASQVDLHAQYGGVFPEMASRQHIRTIYTIIENALQEAHLSLDEVDAIAVTRGPGLPGSLVVGMNVAKGLALAGPGFFGAANLPLIGINHLEAHIYSAWIDWLPAKELEASPAPEIPQKLNPRFPLLALIVSGGHTELVLMKDHLQYQRLGGTLDDAAGEAFDKVARLLGLGYPGGPAIQQAAQDGDPHAFGFPRAWLDDSWNFSFSGLKTAVLREVKALQGSTSRSSDEHTGYQSYIGGYRHPLPVSDLAASFQQAVVDILVGKTIRAAREFKATEILVAGGVSANTALRDALLNIATCPVHIPPIALCTDNAAMIAAAGYFRFAFGQRDPLDMDVLPNWLISEVSIPA